MAIEVGQSALASDFINRSEADATPANDAGKVVKLESNGKIHPYFMEQTYETITFEPMDGSATPIPVAIQADGSFAKSDANGGAAVQKFHGFIVDDLSNIPVTSALNGGQASSFNPSITVNAGDDRLLVVAFAIDSGSPPSALTWNGVAGVNVFNVATGSRTMSMWCFPAGSSGSNTTASIVPTGGSGTVTAFYSSYSDVDQANPIADSESNTLGGGDNLSVTITPTEYRQMVVGCAAYTSNPASFTAGISDTGDSTAPRSNFGHGLVIGVSGTTVTLTKDSGSSLGSICLGVIALKNAGSGTSNLHFGGILGGFTGLTKGADYYVLDTAGTIGTTPGTNSIKCGKALSDTELLIIQS